MRRLKQRWRLEPRILISLVLVLDLQKLGPVAALPPTIVVLLVLFFALDRQIFAKNLLRTVTSATVHQLLLRL